MAFTNGSFKPFAIFSEMIKNAWGPNLQFESFRNVDSPGCSPRTRNHQRDANTCPCGWPFSILKSKNQIVSHYVSHSDFLKYKKLQTIYRFYPSVIIVIIVTKIQLQLQTRKQIRATKSGFGCKKSFVPD